MKPGLAIFDIKGMAKAIRYTEYESIFSALSEIVDNSLEAKANEILIVCYESINNDGKKFIKDIAIIDNGVGMNDEILHGCLVFGNSPKKETIGMGKFGVGLGQASMYAAPRVEVVSWQEFGCKKMVYLDTELMSDGRQIEIDAPQIVQINDWLKPFLLNFTFTDNEKFNFTKSGAIVKWVGVDNVKGELSKFYTNLHLELGRRFRYYISNGCKIGLTNTQHSPKYLIPAIDPLHILKESQFLGDSNKLGYLAKDNNGEPLFEPYISELTPNGECEIDIRLERREVPFSSKITIKASIVKEKFYYSAARSSGKQNPGDTEIGKLVRKYERVSVIRFGREIQFDRFGLYESINDPVNRWWRIEILFSPELDDFFGLSSNKQKVEFKLQYKPEKGETYYDDESLEAKAWRKILIAFDKLLKSMRARNSQLSKNTRTNKDEILETKIIGVGESSAPYFSTSQPIESKKILDNNATPILRINYDSHNEIVQLFKNYLEVSYEKIDSDSILRIEKINKVYTPFLNKNHNLVKNLLSKEELMLGFNLFLTALSNIRENFKIYDETVVFDKIILHLNEEFDYLDALSEDN